MVEIDEEVRKGCRNPLNNIKMFNFIEHFCGSEVTPFLLVDGLSLIREKRAFWRDGPNISRVCWTDLLLWRPPHWKESHKNPYKNDGVDPIYCRSKRKPSNVQIRSEELEKKITAEIDEALVWWLKKPHYVIVTIWENEEISHDF